MKTYRYHVQWRELGGESWSFLARTHRAHSEAERHAANHVFEHGGTSRIWDSRSNRFSREYRSDGTSRQIDDFAVRLADEVLA